jgi:rubrerythrin
MNDDVWYCTNCQNAMAGRAKRQLPDKCPACGAWEPPKTSPRLFERADL